MEAVIFISSQNCRPKVDNVHKGTNYPRHLKSLRALRKSDTVSITSAEDME